jgi:hypothetical protein
MSQTGWDKGARDKTVRVPSVTGIPSGFGLKNDPLERGIWFNVGELWVGGRRGLVNRPPSRDSPLGGNSSWEERKPAGAPRRTVFWPEKMPGIATRSRHSS